MHHRVAHQHHFHHVIKINTRLLANFFSELLQGHTDGRGHFPFAAGVHHHIRNAGHEIFAEANLRIHQTSTGYNLACGEIGEMGSDSGGAYIDGDSKCFVMEAWPD